MACGFIFHIMCVLEFTCNVMAMSGHNKMNCTFTCFFFSQKNHQIYTTLLLLNKNKWLYHKKFSAGWQDKWALKGRLQTFNHTEQPRDGQDPKNKNICDFLPVTLSDSLQECENIPELLISIVWCCCCLVLGSLSFVYSHYLYNDD